MRRAVLFVVLALAGLAAAAGLRSAGAQEAQATLWVTGMRIDGKKARAVVRLLNTSASGQDLFAVHYTVQAGNAGEPLSLVAAGPTGAILSRGDTLELDLGDIVTKYRASLGMGPYAGPVRLVAYADASGRPFGKDVVLASATQSEGAATYAVPVVWR